MLCVAISAGTLFAYVFAFSLVIVQDSNTKSKSCCISYEKAAASLAFCWPESALSSFPGAAEVQPTYLLKNKEQFAPVK